MYKKLYIDQRGKAQLLSLSIARPVGQLLFIKRHQNVLDQNLGSKKERKKSLCLANNNHRKIRALLSTKEDHHLEQRI